MLAAQGQFAMELNEPQNLAATTVEVFSLQDRSLYQQGYGPQQTHLAVAAGLARAFTWCKCGAPWGYSRRN